MSSHPIEHDAELRARLGNDTVVLRARVAELESWCKDAAEQLNAAEAKEDAANARIAELEQRLSGEVANHNCTVADAQAAVDKLEAENARLLACAVRDEDEINNGDARIAELARKIDGARSLINRHDDMELSAPECIECIRKVLT